MSNSYETGVIYGWNGGECPVHPDTRIIFWTNEGRFEADANHCRWSKDTTGLDPDVIAFQVTKPYVEPKVIWVNETVSGYVQAYLSEEAAKNNAQPYHTRIAVKYVEAKE